MRNKMNKKVDEKKGLKYDFAQLELALYFPG